MSPSIMAAPYAYNWMPMVMYRKYFISTNIWVKGGNEHHSVSSHRYVDCLFHRLFRSTTTKTSKLRRIVSRFRVYVYIHGCLQSISYRQYFESWHCPQILCREYIYFGLWYLLTFIRDILSEESTKGGRWPSNRKVGCLVILLSHWGLNTTADILHPTFAMHFFWKKILYFDHFSLKFVLCGPFDLCIHIYAYVFDNDVPCGLFVPIYKAFSSNVLFTWSWNVFHIIFMNLDVFGQFIIKLRIQFYKNEGYTNFARNAYDTYDFHTNSLYNFMILMPYIKSW